METKPHILYVDDIADTCEMVAHAFDQDGRCAVETAGSGIAALNRIYELRLTGKAFTACVIDVAMPMIDGYTLARMIRLLENSNPAVPKTRINFITAHGPEVVDRRAMKLSNVEFCWFRPQHMERLPQRVIDWLAKEQVIV